MVKEQIDLLAHMPPEDIPSGCDIPLELFTRYFPHNRMGPILVELGAGTGDKANAVRNAVKGAVLAVDVNPEAVSRAEKHGLVSVTADVRRFEIFDGIGNIMLLETSPGVYMEGLLANQRGDDWKRVLTTADILLCPEGFLFVADMKHAQDPSAALSALPDGEEERYKERWLRRYEENQKAGERLGISIAPGEFMVTKKPSDNEGLEWGTADDLIRLFGSSMFERWARHISYADIQSHLAALGLTPVYHEDRIWTSRKGDPLSGFVGVWQKGDYWKYNPWYKGHTWDERDAINEDRKFASRADPDYVAKWIAGLRENLPSPEEFLPSVFDTDSTS